MAVTSTPRFNLTLWSADTDERSRTQYSLSLQNVEDRAAIFRKGAIEDRPIASAVHDRSFWLDNSGILWVCDGTTWMSINQLGTPSPLAFNSVAAEGTSPAAIRADHVHQMPGFGVAADITTANTNGTAPTASRADHIHKIGTGAINVSTLFAAGVINAAAIGAGAIGGTMFADGAIDTVGRFADGVIGSVQLADVPLATPGIIMAWPHATAPTGWQKCDGTLLVRADYPALFAAIGLRYSTADPSTHFRVPNFTGYTLMGFVPGATDSDFAIINQRGGAKTVALNGDAVLPSHAHSSSHQHGTATSSTNGEHTHPWGVGGANIGVGGTNPGVQTSLVAGGGFSTRLMVSGSNQMAVTVENNHNHTMGVNYNSSLSGTAGTSTAHANIQPYITLNFIIKT